MVELLAIEKARLLAANGAVTLQDFRAAWEACWWTMVLERAWPHATRFRRRDRIAMLSTRHEARAAFLSEATTFSWATERLSMAANGMCLRLAPEQIPLALLAAIAYVQTAEDVAADHDELVAV